MTDDENSFILRGISMQENEREAQRAVDEIFDGIEEPIVDEKGSPTDQDPE